MQEPALDRQVAQAINDVHQLLRQIEPNDPVLDWFSFELHQLEHTDSDGGGVLSGANARLGGLRQLRYLIEHQIERVQGATADLKMIPDSFGTVMARMPSHVFETAKALGFTISPELLHDPTAVDGDFDPVSPTAKVVAFLRELDRRSDFAWMPDLSAEGEALLQSLGIVDAETRASMAVLFLSRYHAINALLEVADHGEKQVIEFAAGISPRGYQWAKMSPGTIYVESDLPELMLHKSKLVRDRCMDDAIPARGLHHCCAVNVFDAKSLRNALENLDTTKPFTIVTEGLLLYFSDDEMQTFLTQMHGLLTEYPQASWVTDFVAKSHLRDLFESHRGVAAGVKSVFSQVGRSVVGNNPFETESCIVERLSRHQLSVAQTLALKDVNDQMTFDADVSPTQRDEIVGQRKVWRIRATGTATS